MAWRKPSAGSKHVKYQTFELGMECLAFDHMGIHPSLSYALLLCVDIYVNMLH